jgi:hypothetical protein
MRFIPLVVMLGCTVGLVDETKPIVAEDTAVTDTAEDTDTTDTEDTEDSGPDIDENSENPYNGECGDNRDNDGDGRVDCNDSDCASAPECNQSADGDTDGDGFKDDVDCDPYNPYVNPGASEIDNNGIDDDCDGVVDSGNTGSGGNGGSGGGNPTPGTVCSDTCTDGFGNILYGANDGTCQDGGFGDGIALITGVAACAFGTDCSDCGIRTDADGDFHEDDPLGLGLALYADCDDTDPTINSSATDIPGDGIDQDCDGSDASTGGGGGTTTPSSESDCSDGVDEDQDGLTDCDDSDCASDAACQSTGGGGSTGGCSSTEVVDCNGNCAPAYWVGDGSCDDGAYAYGGNQIDLDCATHNNDGGDCATSSGGGGGSTSNCGANEVEDCTGTCLPSSWQGDGICDHSPNGTGFYGDYSLNCSALNFDDGDCPDASAAGCAPGEVLDCNNTCVDELLLGNGTCDDGTSGSGADLDCTTWYSDNNDC